MGRRLSRRELATLVGGAVVALGAERLAATPRGRVGTAPLGVDGLDPAVARRALDRALVAATGATSALAAARRLFKPTDTVGIKLNCLAGRNLSPRPELVAALARLLTDAGVAPGRIIAFDRSARELRRAGFAVNREGGEYLCYGIDNDYDAEPQSSGAIGSCFARLVSTTCSALVSFGVVKDHDLSGVSAGAKNWYGVIHNPNKYHASNCDPYLADVMNHPFVRGKHRLTVLDGVVGQCHGGPAYRADMTFPLATVAVSTDMLAGDAWAWGVLDRERQRRGLARLADDRRAPRFLATAQRYGLGVGDPAAVEVLAG